MARIIIVIAAVILALLLFRWIKNQPPGKRWQVLMVVIGVILLGLVVTGRLHWLYAVVGALIPALQRLLGLVAYLPVVQRLYRTFGGKKPTGGQTSQVETRFLHMELDHDSGKLSGTVKAGTFAGKSLQDLTLEQLLQLHAEYAQSDEDSKLLLENYIDRFHGTNWRTSQSDQDESQRHTATLGNGPLTREEACAILGVEENADQATIIAAHKHLMQKLHPDRGGSSYLASKINQAKDLLLKHVS